MRFNRNKKCFTLVELLVVIAIIGLLASVVIVSVNSARQKARDSRRTSDAKGVQTAVELFRDGNDGNAPTTAAVWTDLVPTYLPNQPADPGNNAYVYVNAGDDETYSFEFVTEADGSLGDAGAKCATSTQIIDDSAAAGGDDDCSNNEG